MQRIRRRRTAASWFLLLLVVIPLDAVARANIGGSRLAAWELSVRAGGRRSIEGRELYAFLEVAAPLEALLTPGVDAPFPEAARQGLAQESGAASEREATPPQGFREPPELTAEASAKSPGRGASRWSELNTTVLLDSALVRECVRRALAVSRDGRGAERLSNLGSRARSSAVLPDLKLRGGRSTDQSLRLSPTTEDPYRYTQSDGTDLFFEATLAWRLSRLIYDSDELAVQRLRLQHESARAKRVEKVLELLADWQAAAARFADRVLPYEERVDAWVRLSVAGFWLDAMTGGWFTPRVASRLAELTTIASRLQSGASR